MISSFTSLERKSVARRGAHALVLLVSSGVMFGCDSPLSTREGARGTVPEAGTAVVSSATRTAYFLPPLGPQRAATGELDRSISPVVEICVWADNRCEGPLVARFTSAKGKGTETIKHSHAESGHYFVNWHLNRSALDASRTYRIRVLDGTAELTATSVSNGNGISAHPPTANGQDRTIPIRFRVEAAPSGTPRGPDPQLYVVLGAGVVGSPVVGESTHTLGTTVSYQFTAAPGYENVLVTLDDQFVSATGTVTLDRSRILYATADRTVTLTPGDETLVQSVRSVLTASNPAAAYQAHLLRVSQLVGQVGVAEAVQRLAVVSYLAIDPVGDADALRRVDAALAARTFSVPVTRSAVQSATQRTESSAVLEQSSRVPTTFFYVNGVLNAYDQAGTSTGALARVVSESGIDGPYKVDFHYNRTARVQIADQRVACAQDLARAQRFVGPLSQRARFARCMGDLVYLRNFDFMEALRQVLELSNLADLQSEADAKTLGARLRRELDMDRNVIVVPHSQGNLMTMQGINVLGTLPAGTGRGTECVGAVSLASPMSSNWPVPPTRLLGLAVRGDFILMLGLNDFPQTTTAQSQAADAEVGGWAALSAANPWAAPVVEPMIAYLRLTWGVRLHDAVDSYMQSPETRDQMRSALGSYYRNLQNCGSVTYSGYWTRTGEFQAFNPFLAVVTRDGETVSVKWQFASNDIREGTATVSGNTVVWNHTSFADPVWHRLDVTFDASGCTGTWHHDHETNNFYQFTSPTTCRVVSPGQVRMLRVQAAPTPRDSVARLPSAP